jgi:putative membrane protein
MLIFWVRVIERLVLVVKWLIQTTKGDKDVVHSSSRALEILNERYAKGEIEKEEFEKVKRDLQS